MSMDEKASSFWRGTVKVVTDWTPTAPGGDFKNYKIVKGSDLLAGLWRVPVDMQGKRARVVLFSGAQGGQGGYAGGTNGNVRGGYDNITLYSSDENEVLIGGLQDGVQDGADGGAGGKGGSGATRMVSIDIDELEASYLVEFGNGGAGGAGGAGSLLRARDLPLRGSDGRRDTRGHPGTCRGADARWRQAAHA